jgi:hypothetical protein
MPDTGAPWNLPYPAPSDLVRNGPAQFEALADAVADGLLIKQVVQTVKTDTFVTSSATFVDVTGLAVTITPSTNTSKVLVIVQLTTAESQDGALGFWKVVGGNMGTYIGNTEGTRTRAVTGGHTRGETNGGMQSQSIVYLDSPATGSAVTYQVQAGINDCYLNRASGDGDGPSRGRGASSITAIEVVA